MIPLSFGRPDPSRHGWPDAHHHPHHPFRNLGLSVLGAATILWLSLCILAGVVLQSRGDEARQIRAGLARPRTEVIGSTAQWGEPNRDAAQNWVTSFDEMRDGPFLLRPVKLLCFVAQ